MNTDSWKDLFAAAMQQIKQSGLPPSMWTVGGGTVLMHKFNHRFSKRMSGIHLAIPVFSKGYRPKQGKVAP